MLPEMPDAALPQREPVDSTCSIRHWQCDRTGEGEGKDCILVLILKFTPAAFASAQGQKMRKGGV